MRAIEVPADAGTAFDGRHLYQLASDRIQKIDPATGRVLAYCGGGPTGKVRAVKRPRRRA